MLGKDTGSSPHEEKITALGKIANGKSQLLLLGSDVFEGEGRMPSRLGLSDILATGVQEMEKVSIHPSLSTYGLAQGSSTSISVLVPLLPPSGLKLSNQPRLQTLPDPPNSIPLDLFLPFP